jgi:D-alanyl-D-alanine carboxypeptidase/D-alanyl-D-alanine-endopeptidase (penicillin-binding protein 4)
MLAVGLLLALSLSLVPYSLLATAGRMVASLMPGHRAEEQAAAELPPPPPPLFDAAGWYAEHDEDPEQHGILIETLDGTRVYASHNPDKTFNPASLMKLATTLAVLRRLGPDYRFETRVYTEGTIDKTGTLRGSVYVAGGDPTFGDAGGVVMAKELKARGVTRVEKELVVTEGFSFNNSEKEDDSAKRLSKMLQLREKATRVGDAPSGEPLFVIESNPLREILLYMNAHSNNFVAEHLGELVGGPAGLKKFLVEELKLPEDQVEVQRTSGREHNRLTARGIVAVVRALREEAERHGMKLEDLMPVAGDDSGTLRRRIAGGPLEGALVGKTGTLTQEVDGGMASLAGVVYTEQAGAIVFAILDRGNRIAENRELEDTLLEQVIASQDVPHSVARAEERRQLLPPSSLTVAPEELGGSIELTAHVEDRKRDTSEEDEGGAHVRSKPRRERDTRNRVARGREPSRRQARPAARRGRR